MLRFIFKSKEIRGKNKEIRTFWIYALGEFFLVFLGILIALQVDNWNQDRRLRKQEDTMLEELLENLKSDLADVDLNIRLQNSAMASSRIILGFLDGEGPWHDSLATHFVALTSGTVFFENISSYESLKSLGIDLISNDSIRLKMTHLYSVTYDYVNIMEERALTHIFEVMNASMAKHLRMIEFPRCYFPLDASKLRLSNEFRHNLLSSITFNRYMLGLYTDIKEDLADLIQDIEEELGLEPEATN